MSRTANLWLTALSDQWHHGSPLIQQAALVGVTIGVLSLGRLVVWWALGLNDIPVIGDGLISSYLNPKKVAQSWRSLLKQGYAKYRGPGGVFRVADGSGWNVFICDPKLTDELMKLPDSVLSVMDAISQSLQVDYTLGPTVHSNAYHIGVIQHNLTRNLGALFPSLVDEIEHSFMEEIPSSVDSKGWSTFRALPVAMNIASRVANRAFVGLPLCRNKQYLGINVLFAMDVVGTARKLKKYPEFLKPLVIRFIGNLPIRHATVHKLLEPVINERYKILAEHDNSWDSVPNDILTWIMQTAEGDERKADRLTHRILAVNFAAIHTTSMNFTWVLFYLAAHQEYIPPLREEIQQVMSEEPWSKSALSRCRKLDSVMKEVMRMTVTPSSANRIALQDIRLSNGVVIKKGTKVSVAAEGLHHDPALYGEDADKFDGFRFSKLRASTEKESLKHQVVFNNTEFVAFGTGRHACPGRFFAANEIKALTAYAVMNYDMTYADPAYGNGRVPSGTGTPNPGVQIMFKKRKSEVVFPRTEEGTT